MQVHLYNFAHVNGYQMLFRKRKGVFSFRLGFPSGYWCMVGRAALAAAMPPCSAPRAFC